MGVNTQPLLGLQESLVQALLSLHVTAGCWQTPPLQESLVHALLSSQPQSAEHVEQFSPRPG
jgi:hypothetical protein